MKFQCDVLENKLKRNTPTLWYYCLTTIKFDLSMTVKDLFADLLLLLILLFLFFIYLFIFY
jgi:hypothetical protein